MTHSALISASWAFRVALRITVPLGACSIGLSLLVIRINSLKIRPNAGDGPLASSIVQSTRLPSFEMEYLPDLISKLGHGFLVIDVDSVSRTRLDEYTDLISFLSEHDNTLC